jgi:antirestriction protein ArdC
MTHYSGHPSRLNRNQSGIFGSPEYQFEEIVVEIGAAFLCASLSITPTVWHSDYIGSWIDCIRQDNRLIIRAASAASKAADYLLAFRDGDRASGDAGARDQTTGDGQNG